MLVENKEYVLAKTANHMEPCIDFQKLKNGTIHKIRQQKLGELREIAA